MLAAINHLNGIGVPPVSGRLCGSIVAIGSGCSVAPGDGSSVGSGEGSGPGSGVSTGSGMSTLSWSDSRAVV